MKQFLCSKLKKMIFRDPKASGYLDKIQELENQIEQIKLQINDRKIVKINKVVVEKIVCEKIETNYKIDSVAVENLTGTMNIGTVYPSSKLKWSLNKKENSLGHTEPEKPPRINMVYE